MLNVHIEEAGDGTSVVVACLLEAVTALDSAGVALVGIGIGALSCDGNGGDGESEDGGELGEHRESRWCARR